MKDDQKYLKSLIDGLVTVQELVEIERIVDEKGILLTVTVHKEDMGKIIGKDGETARAIRKIMRQYAAIHDSHIAIKINEPKA